MKFTDLLSEHGVRYLTEGNHHCRPGWVQLDCPFCGRNAGKFHMGYSIEKNFVSCWKCGHHRLGETLAELTGLTVKQAIKALEGVERFKVERIEKQGKLVPPKCLGPLLPAHRKYLRSRGYVPDDIERVWKVQGIGVAPRLSWRLFIPIHLRGEVVSWTTRSVSASATLRYVSASEDQEAVPHKSLLYGEDLARHAICVVEGPLDAWKVGPGCVATCGTSYTRAQLLRMSRYPVIGLCFDNEPTAQARAAQLRDDLSAFGGSVMNIRLDAKDAGEASDKELRQIRKALGL